MGMVEHGTVSLTVTESNHLSVLTMTLKQYYKFVIDYTLLTNKEI